MTPDEAALIALIGLAPLLVLSAWLRKMVDQLHEAWLLVSNFLGEPQQSAPKIREGDVEAMWEAVVKFDNGPRARLELAMKFYDILATEFNISIRRLPLSLVAGWTSQTRRPLFSESRKAAWVYSQGDDLWKR